LKFKKFIRSLPEGETVVVRTTDPDSVNDFESFAKMKGYKIIDHQQSDYDFVFWIRV